ncbi:hypothetical protein GCM10027194_25630 [Thalassiella azotivora]
MVADDTREGHDRAGGGVRDERRVLGDVHGLVGDDGSDHAPGRLAHAGGVVLGVLGHLPTIGSRP